ncbi:hypothetical protein BKA82DRAFT_4195721, partial [Pisolithus tinctorius]
MENPVKFGTCLLLCTFMSSLSYSSMHPSNLRPNFLPSEVGSLSCLCITPYRLLEFGNIYNNLQSPIYTQTATTMSHFSQVCPVVLTFESQNIHMHNVMSGYF